jgi:hypothetical protein
MMGLPNCREVAARLSREQDDPGIARRGMGLRLHLLMCPHCRRYGQQLGWIRANIRYALAHAGPMSLSANARERIRERLKDS